MAIDRRLSRPRTGRPLLLSAAMVLLAMAAAARERLALRQQSIALPGAPAVVHALDLTGDGRRDLAVVVAWTEWSEIGITERTEMDEIDGLVEVLTVVPTLLDQRELRLFAAEDSGYRELPALPLPGDVLSVLAAPDLGLLAITDRGVSRVRLDGDSASLEDWIEDPPVAAGSGVLLPGLGVVSDLDDDGHSDLLFPAADGWAIYPGSAAGLERAAAARLPLVGDERSHDGRRWRYPLPAVADADGDGRSDLVVTDALGSFETLIVLHNQGERRWSAGPDLLQSFPDAAAEAVLFADVDGDGRAELVTQHERETPDDASMREELAAAKRPDFTYGIHPLTALDTLATTPSRTFQATGYAFGGEDQDIRLPGGFSDLDGDGRLDLVSITLDFSLMQAVRILATQRISIGLDFHVQCQQPDGSFRRVEGLDLSGKLRLDLSDLSLGQLSMFAGDFDGDGRRDFVQLGRGRKVTIHRGGEGCTFPPSPDLVLELEDEPLDLSLVQVRDLDGDGRADLLLTQPGSRDEVGETAPVRLDLYLSGEVR